MRRLTRHQRWLIGPGTVFGLRVDTTLPLSALAWVGGTVTATTAALHGFTIGDTAQVTIIGATPAGYQRHLHVHDHDSDAIHLSALGRSWGGNATGVLHADATDVRLMVSPGYAIDGLGLRSTGQ